MTQFATRGIVIAAVVVYAAASVALPNLPMDRGGFQVLVGIDALTIVFLERVVVTGDGMDAPFWLMMIALVCTIYLYSFATNGLLIRARMRGRM
jgi:hypothetical protein